jgi:mannose-6-phosphate isomerase-like protein (cupin superfamily)
VVFGLDKVLGLPADNRIEWERGDAMGEARRNSSFEVVDLAREAAGEGYENHPVARVNDHEVRISRMTEAYHWHCHPDSDESFLSVEGGLLIDFDDRTVELRPGQMLTVERGVRHRTRPAGARSVNLTFERVNARSEALAAPE